MPEGIAGGQLPIQYSTKYSLDVKDLLRPTDAPLNEIFLARRA